MMVAKEAWHLLPLEGGLSALVRTAAASSRYDRYRFARGILADNLGGATCLLCVVANIAVASTDAVKI